MARNMTLIHRFGEDTTAVANQVIVAAYTVPAGAELRISDIKVMCGATGANVLDFYLNEAVLGHLFRAQFPAGGAGIYSARWETPMVFTPGQIVSILADEAAVIAGIVVAAEWEGELLV